jgi:tetratricopeptide (TPR) repeat protein
VKPLFSLIFILILSNGKATIPDSLLKVSALLKSDTDRVNLFYKEGFNNRAVDPQYSYECAKLAEQYSREANLPYYIAKANNLLGILYFRKNDLSKAIVYHKNALNLRTIIGDKKGIALSQTNLGNIYTSLKQYALAEDAYLKALDANNQLDEQKQAGNCLLNLGVLNAEQKKYSAAKNYFDQALRNASNRYDYELKAMCLNNLADINLSLHQPDEAIANCVNSIKAKELMDNEMEMADSYLNLASAYFMKNEINEGRQNLKIADSIIRKFDYTEAKINLFKLTAEELANEKKYEEALRYFSQYLSLKDSVELAGKEIDLSNNFIEEYLAQKPVNDERAGFPYLYLNILIIGLISVIAFVFFPKQ